MNHALVGWALAGAALGVVGTVLIVSEVKASAAQSQPAANPLLRPITDKATVTYYQNGLAQGLLQRNTNQIPGLTATTYPVTAVDGNPANPTWMAALAIFQKWANAQVATNTPPGFRDAPAGFPSALRTDGVLDYATAIVLANS
jgi:hypothetical protein